MVIGKRKKRRKKAPRKKKATTKKAGGGRKRPVVDHTKDPVFKLKPNDIIEYTFVSEDGEATAPELHIVLEYTYDREVDRRTDQPTLELRDGKLCASTLYCWGKDACKITNLTETHKLELTFVDGKATWKLNKKRQRRRPPA